MKKIVLGIAGLAAGFTVAGASHAATPAKPAAQKGAAAAPAKKGPRVWIQHVTTAFEHKVPNTWSLLEKNRRDPSDPTVGSWRFASANGHSKMFIRVSVLKEGGIKGAFERAIPLMKKRVDQLKELSRMVLPVEQDKRPAGILFFTGNTVVKNRTTKAVEGRAHLIARFFKQYPDLKRQVAISYLFAAGKDDQMEKFMKEHIATFVLHNPIEVAKEVIKAVKADPRPVVSPAVPSASKLKAALKALGKGGEALIKAPSQAAPKK